MLLRVGDKLGPYEIIASIGKGGMGEVYRAHDSRLNRDVAIKVSNEQFTERFTREARAIAALNHTNICHLYDVGADYLVMEYVEGRDLRGPLDFDDAIPIVHQLIDGIEAAHEKNIIHRDLKPANIKITPEGVVKILDFGLAKAMEPPPAQDGNPENSPTFTMGGTQAGTILGTAAYMSPEQAKGKAADRRSDIWSFGVIVYEILSGQRLFSGDSAVEILGAVLNREPDISAAPARSHRLLRWCLEKDRKRRLASISDARRMLGADGAGPEESARVPSRSGRWPWIVAALFAMVSMVALWAPWHAVKPMSRPLVRLDVDLGSEYSGELVIISPDGARLVFMSNRRLFTRRLDQAKATELEGTEGARFPFFSPDGQWVAFFTERKLKKIAVEGGSAIALCDAPAGRGGAWGEDHTIVAALTTSQGLSRIPDAGGTPEPLTELAQGEYTHRWPQILPGGKAVLFTTNNTAGMFDGASIDVFTLRDRRRKTLYHGGTFGRYLPTSSAAGHLVYVNKGTLFAVPFDPDTLQVDGTPSPVLQGVSYAPATNGSAQFDYSREGTVVYRSGDVGGMVVLEWLDGGNKLQSLQAKAGAYGEMRFSPNGKLIALTVPNGGGTDIWIYDWQRDAMSKLTSDDGTLSRPVWSPDGHYLVFGANSEIFWTRADGAGKPQPLTRNKGVQFPGSFSPDGKRLAFTDFGSGNGVLWTMAVENEGGGLRAGKPEIVMQNAANEGSPAFSPDGSWMAYTSNEAGKTEIYVRSFPGKDGKWQISNTGGAFPTWSRKGHELFYCNPDQQIMVVSYTSNGDLFVPDKPRLWSTTRLANTGFRSNLDISPDGKRFIVLMPSETAGQHRATNQVTFLSNFFDEVRRRIAVAKQ